MVKFEMEPRHAYPLLLFGLAASAYGMRQLLEIRNLLADSLAAILMFLSATVTVAAIVHYWRYVK